jgi:hypothetical protein
MNDLHHLLREATDHLAQPDLVGPALASARRTRARRATATGVAVTVLVLGGVAWAVGDHDPRADVTDASTPTPSPTSVPTAVTTGEADLGTQPQWDPFDVIHAPRRDSVLPVRLDPPESPPSVLDAPLPSVALAWPEEGRELRLLGTNGEWRSVPGTASVAPSSLRDVADPAIASDGSLVAFSSEAGLWVVDVVAGERTVLPWPEEIAGPTDTPAAVRWLPGDDAVLVLHWRTPWAMGLDGSDEPVSYLDQYTGGLAIDPDGPVLERRFQTGEIVEWLDGEVVRRVDDGGIAWGERAAAGYGLFAITASLGDWPHAGPVVIDAGTGERVAYAPVRDRNGVYSDNGRLTAKGFLDEDTLLLLVGPMDFRTMEPGEGEWHLVAWSFRSGGFELLASGDDRMHAVAVAPALLAE